MGGRRGQLRGRDGFSGPQRLGETDLQAAARSAAGLEARPTEAKQGNREAEREQTVLPPNQREWSSAPYHSLGATRKLRPRAAAPGWCRPRPWPAGASLTRAAAGRVPGRSEPASLAQPQASFQGDRRVSRAEAGRQEPANREHGAGLGAGRGPLSQSGAGAEPDPAGGREDWRTEDRRIGGPEQLPAGRALGSGLRPWPP